MRIQLSPTEYFKGQVMRTGFCLFIPRIFFHLEEKYLNIFFKLTYTP